MERIDGFRFHRFQRPDARLYLRHNRYRHIADWSSLGLVNMAYGFIFALSGYGARLASVYLAPFPPLVMAVGILTGAIGGVFVCLVAFIPVHDKPNFPIRALIATLAISLAGNQVLLWIFGPRAKSLPQLFGRGKVEIFGVVLTTDKIGASLSAIVLLSLILLWMRSSRRGLEIRAMMMNPHAAAIVGIGVRRTAISVMALTGRLPVLQPCFWRRPIMWHRSAASRRWSKA